MLKNINCPKCKAEIVLRYHISDKTFKIVNGKITRNDIHTGQYFDDPELIFECSNDKGHNIYIHDHYGGDQWENTIREEFYRGAYYED